MVNNKRNVTLNKNDLRGKNLPLLHEDKSWIELFGDLKNREILEARENLIALINELKTSKEKQKNLKKEKQKSMKAILNVSYEINKDEKDENVVVLDELKAKMLKMGEEIDELEFRLESLPDEIRQANIDLLNATINSGYSQLKDKEKKLDKSVVELEKSRKAMSDLLIKIRELQEIKEVEGKWIDDTYTFMHRILGNNLIEKIDREVF